MKVTIEYCTRWNYEPRASSLGAELAGRFAAEVELLASSGGAFEIRADGRLLFSKKQLRRFPEAGEIAALIAANAE